MQKRKEIKKEEIVKDLVRVIKRLSLNHSMVMYRYDNFQTLIKKIESKKVQKIFGMYFKQMDKEDLSEYIEMMYYLGKNMAYQYCLVSLVGLDRANELLLKGIKGEKDFDKYGKRIKKK